MTKECEYCGQQVLVSYENEEGWERCSCAGAKLRKRYEKLVLKGDELIDEIFAAPEEECGFLPANGHALDLLHYVIRNVARADVGSVAVRLTDGSRADIRINRHGELEISRSRNRKITNTTNQH